MAEETLTVETFKGICSFCKEEINKKQMTQHLKSCKQRKVTIADTNDAGKKQKSGSSIL